MNKHDLIKRTKLFAHNCIKLSLKLPRNALGKHIESQLIRSSTSVAANYRAACKAQTKPTFISKISIVIEEADESEFWLELIEDENLLNLEEVRILKNEAHELASIFITARRTAQKNLK
jgi:four helix bundle protein